MSRLTYNVPLHVELVVRRPTGEVETVVAGHEQLGGNEISQKTFEKIADNTRRAGRGELLSYRNVYEQRTETDAQYAERIRGEAADRMLARDRRLEAQVRGDEPDECAHQEGSHEPAHPDDRDDA